MKSNTNKMSYTDSLNIVKTLFDTAINDFKFLSGQAWAYTLDEVDSMLNNNDPKLNVVVLTAVYKIALLNNVILSVDDDYTSDMLNILLMSYQEFYKCSSIETDIETSELSALKKDMLLIENHYLIPNKLDCHSYL